MLLVSFAVLDRLLESLVQVGLDPQGGFRIGVLAQHNGVNQDNLEQELVCRCLLAFKLELGHLKDSLGASLASRVVKLSRVKSVERHHKEEVLVAVNFLHHFDVLGCDFDDLRGVLLILRLSLQNLDQQIVELCRQRVL